MDEFVSTIDRDTLDGRGFSGLERGKDGVGVRVVRGCDHYSIDFRLLFEHFAEVRPVLGIRKFFESTGGMVLVHIAQSHGVLARKVRHVGKAHAPDADSSDAKFPTGRCRLSEEWMAGCCGDESGFQKITAVGIHEFME